MAEQVNQARALQILKEEVTHSQGGSTDVGWVQLVEQLSRVCEGGSKTFIAFLGTALLAKATNLKIDPFAVKVKAGTPGAYSARALAQHVLAAHAPKLEIDIGVTGREPLNNQPFFRINSVSREDIKEIVIPSARAAVDVLCDALERLERVKDVDEARLALRSFLKVRRSRKATYELNYNDIENLLLTRFIEFVRVFVAGNSEGGRRAQAIAAGILDVVMGPDRVAADKINDPDRHVPGDIAIRADDGGTWERTFEVRDKVVAEPDLYHLVGKAGRSGVAKAGMLAVAPAQASFITDEAQKWAEERGVDLAVFFGWGEFVRQAAWWSRLKPEALIKSAYTSVHARLVMLEVSEAGIKYWTERMLSESTLLTT